MPAYSFYQKRKSLEGEEQLPSTTSLYSPPTYLLQTRAPQTISSISSSASLLAQNNSKSSGACVRAGGLICLLQEIFFDLCAILAPAVAEVMLEEMALQWRADLLQAME